MDLRGHILAVLKEHERYPFGQPMSMVSELVSTLHLWEDELRDHPVVTVQSTRYVKSGCGKGLKAAVPWLLIGDHREGDGASQGVYLAYLGRPDSRAMLLTLVHSIAELDKQFKGDPAGWEHAISTTAEKLRPSHGALEDRGFSFKPGNPDLGPRHLPPMVRKYERAALAWKSYQRSALPDNAELTRDLEAALSAFDQYIVEHQ